MPGFDAIVYAVVLYGTLALAVWAFVDAIIRPAAGFVAAGKLTKPGWLAITGIAALVLYWRGPSTSSVCRPWSPPSSTWSTSGRPCVVCGGATPSGEPGQRPSSAGMTTQSTR